MFLRNYDAVLTWLVIPERIEDWNDDEAAELDPEEFTIRRKLWPKRNRASRFQSENPSFRPLRTAASRGKSAGNCPATILSIDSNATIASKSSSPRKPQSIHERRRFADVDLLI